MDPNETLRKQRELIAALEAGVISGPDELVDAAEELSELARTLDEWLSKGGFLPDEWDFAYHAPDSKT